MKDPTQAEKRRSFALFQAERSLWKLVRCPGLTPQAQTVQSMAEQIPKRLCIFRYKHSRSSLWVVFIGGTGTGKSTLFNALCGKNLSETGVERPKTSGPIALVHRDALVEERFPFPTMEPVRLPMESVAPSGQVGVTGQMLFVEHRLDELSHLILVDTPDVDSVELKNREAVDDLYLLADVVVFVSSQEKYADEAPYQFLARVLQDGKPYFLLLNKAESVLGVRDVFSSLQVQGLTLEERGFWVFPHVSVNPSAALAENGTFKKFRSDFLQRLAKSESPNLIRQEEDRAAHELKSKIRLLLSSLETEDQAAKKWLEHLNVFFQAACQNLLEQQQRHFSEGSREYLQKEIRQHFSKYDLLRTPRRILSQVILTPFRLLGLVEDKPTESHQEDLLRLRQRIDLVPVRGAIESFNRAVLEKLSPQDQSSALYGELRSPTAILSDEEIKEKVWEEQDRLASWLEETFEELARGIPKSKEWGIYSTSILWGGLILVLETAIGGGITVLEAVLDSAVAPFVTRGAVELFAYHELQKIARELGKRYQDGLISALLMQRDRYCQRLESLLVSEGTLDKLKALMRDLDTQVGAA